MNTEIANPDDVYKISPEALEVAKTYLELHDTAQTAAKLQIAPDKVTYYLRKPDVRRFIDTIFLEQGYMNRGKIQEVMDDIIALKLEEMLEAGVGSNKDILEVMALQHKMRMEEAKLLQTPNDTIKQQVNVQQNFGDNYNSLLDNLIKAGNE